MEIGGSIWNWRMRQGRCFCLQVLGSYREDIMEPLQDFNPIITVDSIVEDGNDAGVGNQLSESPWLGYSILEAWVEQKLFPLKKKNLKN